MTQPPDLSPRAQAILRAIENEAQARRETSNRSNVPGAYTPPTAPFPPMPPPAPPSYVDVSPAAPATAAAPGEPLGKAADRLMRLVEHVVAQTEGVRARVKEVEHSLDLLSDKLAQPATLKPAVAETLKPEVIEPPVPAVEAPAPPVAGAPEPVVQAPEPVVQAPEPVVEAPDPVVEAPATTPAPVTNESDGARLMAIEMAVSGSSRGEVGDRLAHDFGVADPTPFLDDVFGAGSADDSRMPWTS